MTDDFGSSRTKTFEELCRAHIQAFARGAEKYAAETKLSQRVSHWQERLKPILDEEEERPIFDIHQYGQRVVNTIEKELENLKLNAADDRSKQRTIDFSKVTKDCPQYDVCRVFLACLGLSNSGNIRIQVQAGSVDGSSMLMELVRTEIERPMETYLAPSVTDEMAM